MKLEDLIRPIGKTVIEDKIIEEEIFMIGGEVSSKLEFVNIQFLYPLQFENVDFHEPVSFRNCRFDEIVFINIIFRDEFLLYNCNVQKYWDLKDCKFYGSTIISGNMFKQGFSLFPTSKTSNCTNEFYNELEFSADIYYSKQ